VRAVEHGRVGPGSHDFAEEEVVGLLDMRFRNQPALQPAQAAFDQR